MRLFEKTIDRTVIYNGKIIDLEVHDIELPDGSTSKRELIYHNGAVAVCAVTPENEVLLVKQFRKPIEKPLLEIPAGKLESGEDRIEAAKRELQEETGYIASDLELITDMYGSPGFSSEKLTIYFANQLTEGEMNLDEDEFVELHKLPIKDVKSMLDNKEIADAKTIIALQHLLLNYNHFK
ncbi:NUDIX hydrolase [Staphylococcus saccharolyticus]|uniref:NUDIX hydrolase n=1 Tax=Staphylococcus saccharolyticus TaxID=33028 RepID=UPI00102D8895|nr:NUDIX hydrolase [Staphylococcus saccharolyticus]MBL7573253.1 NUDIX hydrolase [Staphylococcus saccharolyticus]MBL7583813.1 NUDIX hydrolase [Staphylococcus saccharolyticus]MBL7638869.1 NUDIX hydrolase [Staphylococcus saccharolyticus]QRJ67651.1 NUDIX hydrolase [Staphylococcus saccharolyticus]TAA93782.1 ADP-ribose pyrophosphatase [Staphylococcus saccharolyticus]